MFNSFTVKSRWNDLKKFLLLDYLKKNKSKISSNCYVCRKSNENCSIREKKRKDKESRLKLIITKKGITKSNKYKQLINRFDKYFKDRI